MQQFNPILAVLAVGLGNIAVCWFVDRILRDRIDTIASGVIRGVQISAEHRRVSFWVSYFMYAWVMAGSQAIVAAGFWLAAKHAVGEDVKLLCYGAMWLTLIGVLGWTLQSVLWYRHFASVLRQAEVD
jgi:hypothetical protein